MNTVKTWLTQRIPNILFASLFLLALTMFLINASSSALTKDEDVYQDTIEIIDGTQFDISIIGEELNGKQVVGGESVMVNPTIYNNGPYDAYVFATITLSEGLKIESMSEDWVEVESGESEGCLWAMRDVLESGLDTTIFNSVKAASEATGSQEIKVHAYAVLADHFEDGTTLETIWATYKGK